MTRSPSIVRTRRSVVCVAGCCGPKLSVQRYSCSTGVSASTPAIIASPRCFFRQNDRRPEIQRAPTKFRRRADAPSNAQQPQVLSRPTHTPPSRCQLRRFSPCSRLQPSAGRSSRRFPFHAARALPEGNVVHALFAASFVICTCRPETDRRRRFIEHGLYRLGFRKSALIPSAPLEI